MAEIVGGSPQWLLKPTPEGSWKRQVRVRRDDGEEVSVEVGCSGTAHTVAQQNGNSEALDHMREFGGLLAIDAAENAPPNCTGIVEVWFDHSDGNPRRRYP